VKTTLLYVSTRDLSFAVSFSLLQPTYLLRIWVEGGCDGGLNPYMLVKNVICHVT